MNALDSTTKRPTLRVERSFTPVVLGADTLAKVAALPQRAVYLALPNGDVDRGLELVRRWYDVGEELTARRRAYTLSSRFLTLRSQRP